MLLSPGRCFRGRAYRSGGGETYSPWLLIAAATSRARFLTSSTSRALEHRLCRSGYRRAALHSLHFSAWVSVLVGKNSAVLKTLVILVAEGRAVNAAVGSSDRAPFRYTASRRKTLMAKIVSVEVLQ